MSIHGRKRFLAFLFIISLTTTVIAGAAGVKLKLSSTEVVDGSPLEVQIEAEGKNILFPDIQDIGGFLVEGQGVSSKSVYSNINGNVTSKSFKTLRLEFYPETNMTIPAFEIKIDGKVYKTKPVAIRVLQPSEVREKSINGYTLQMKSNKKSVFVGEPFVVTIDFFEPIGTSAAKVVYTPPKFKDFFSQNIGTEKITKTATGILHQLQYRVSAKQDGALVIMPPVAKVAIQSFNGIGRDPFGLFAGDVKWHTVRSKPLKITAKPVPADIDIVGKFQVESSVDKTKVKSNSPIAYTIKISGEGSLDDLANPKFDLPGVTVYGDTPKLSSRVVGDKVISQYERKYVFISDRDFVIPALYFKSFDYKSGKKKTLKSKRHEIKVEGEAAVPNGTAIAKKRTDTKRYEKQIKAASVEQSKNANQNKSILEDTEYYLKKVKEDTKGFPLLALIASFFAGIMVTFLGVKLPSLLNIKRGFGSLKHYSNQEALKILYPYTNHDKKVEAMVRKLYKSENGNKNIAIDQDELARMIRRVLDSKRMTS